MFIHHVRTARKHSNGAPWATGPEEGSQRERGDVPGWVLVTLMTAGLVIAIWALAGDALAGVFQAAIDRVMGA